MESSLKYRCGSLKIASDIHIHLVVSKIGRWLTVAFTIMIGLYSNQWVIPFLKIRDSHVCCGKVSHTHLLFLDVEISFQWRHNEPDGASNHQPHNCLLNLYSDIDQRKHQSSASLVFMRGIHWWTVNSPHKRPVTRKMFPFDDIILFPWWRDSMHGSIWVWIVEPANMVLAVHTYDAS